MQRIKYRIYELSVRAILAHAKLSQNGEYIFNLSFAETDKCKKSGASHEQDDNALFYQTMCELHSSGFDISSNSVVADLSDIIFYADFTGIFDRGAYQKKNVERQKKAEVMFSPSGVTLDFGSGAHRYLAFERSGNMSRSARLSFIREDYYEPIRRRIMLDMKIGRCQLSKLYAYNGLMLSGGVRIDGIGIDKPHRVIVIDNPKRTLSNIHVITVVDDGSDAPVRKYSREERRADVEFIEFDGEGLISREYARLIDKKYCGGDYHTSFQIRMPFVKGMLHAVDFKDFLTSAGTETITDIWGVSHRVKDVDMILTKSMFKGYGWLVENKMTWEDYFTAFRKYDHALYITNVNKEKPEEYTELNYQFLNTVSLTAEEFRPADLPDGWDHSPYDDSRRWLTKETEARYYCLCCDTDFRLKYFLDALKSKGTDRNSRKYLLARILKKNPLVINEPVYAGELESVAEKTLENYSLGKLIVPGDNRYLSGDLLRFLVLLVDVRAKKNRSQSTFFSTALSV